MKCRRSLSGLAHGCGYLTGGLTVSAEGPLRLVRAFVPVTAVVAAEPGVDFEWSVRQEKRERASN
jgi:hypothetical protein